MRGNRGRRLIFRRPVRVIEAWQPDEVHAALAAIDTALNEGLHVAGFLGYEAGLALEPKLRDLPMMPPAGEPLLWLGCYAGVEQDTVECAAPMSQVRDMGHPLLSLEEAEYARRVDAVQALIAAGETYQANLTLDARWRSEESAAAMYARLLQAQPVAYAAMLRPREDWHVLSFSPELFFRREGGRMVTKPMKGTADPGFDMAEARAQAAWLVADEKNRAENVMIVDLLRNDLGRVCRMGSVQVTELFAVERYPTVLQMTSTIEGQLREGVGYAEIFAALFPSGSIVGAPKVQTMRRLSEIEGRPRGVYTGAIGYIAPHGEAEFNVAIRTLSLHNREARMGVGSGIVTDSVANLEYAECRTKLAFLTRDAETDFSLIETLLLEDGTYTLLAEHLERMAESAEYFFLRFDESHVKAVLEEARRDAGGKRMRVRLLLDREGHATWSSSVMPVGDAGPVSVLFWPETTDSQDRFLRHKTTRRALYDKALQAALAAGCADAIFTNERGEITEGAIHNVIAVIDGQWITPPLACGLLPGVYRRKLLAEGRIKEGVLRREDLERAEAIYLCNSVRGLRD
ncbi:aminodeoxychorismate synthase component I [Silvibacterium dinghuense]|uniref:aminodeoxychorismate synthase component I n=1 Tax=Silvibacterium dinghuense TaxID=1560006 RepID=UPI0013E91525|nr:aminodeoxychorismate synthase component I [Silvibacterium dinghuense]